MESKKDEFRSFKTLKEFLQYVEKSCPMCGEIETCRCSEPTLPLIFSYTTSVPKRFHS
jgi:hypothetical protein